MWPERDRPPPLPRSSEDTDWDGTWRQIIAGYQSAMVRYVHGLLVRLQGPTDLGEAADVVQDYLATCIEKAWLARDDVQIRCLRAYLQTQLRRFTFGHLDHKRARKRRPQGRRLPAGILAKIACNNAVRDPEHGWIEVAVRRALRELRERNALYGQVIEDLLATEGRGSRDLGERLGRRPRQVDDLRYRARRRFALLFKDELSRTVRDDEAREVLLAELQPLLR